MVSVRKLSWRNQITIKCKKKLPPTKEIWFKLHLGWYNRLLFTAGIVFFSNNKMKGNVELLKFLKLPKAQVTTFLFYTTQSMPNLEVLDFCLWDRWEKMHAKTRCLWMVALCGPAVRERECSLRNSPSRTLTLTLTLTMMLEEFQFPHKNKSFSLFYLFYGNCTVFEFRTNTFLLLVEKNESQVYLDA